MVKLYDIHFASTIALNLFIIVNLIRNTEYFAIFKEFKEGGIFSWSILKLRTKGINLTVIKNLSFLFDYRGFIIELSFSTGLFVSLFFFQEGKFEPIIISILFIINLLFSYRNIYGNDGSDYLLNLLFFCFFILSIFKANQIIVNYTVVFLIAQTLLCYFISGLSKLLSNVWRSGIALKTIFNTKSYGNRSIYFLLTKAGKNANIFFCWLIIFMEILFPLALILPIPLSILILSCGILFHFFNALIMGLNRFLWTFIATYPFIIYLNYHIRKF